MIWHVNKLANGNDYWFTKEQSSKAYIIYQELRDNSIKYVLYEGGRTIGRYDTLQQAQDMGDPLSTQKLDRCRELIKELAHEYSLDGLVLDLRNGWVLRNATGQFITSGNDRIPEYLRERTYKKIVHGHTR